MPGIARVAVSLFFIGCFASCVVTQTEPAEPQPAAAATTDPAPVTPATVDPTASTTPESTTPDPDAGATTPATPSDPGGGSLKPVVGGAKKDGSKCTQASECESGVCEGKGCGPDEGKCAAKDAKCTYDLVTYCGCDGKPFKASGSCPKRTYKKEGAC
jgi:hypothetical protein